MKYLTIFSIIVLVFICQACSSSKNTAKSEADKIVSALGTDIEKMEGSEKVVYESSDEKEKDPGVTTTLDEHENDREILYNNLGDRLRKIGSLQVNGTHPNISIRIRGNSSIVLNNGPLFVIDGQYMGRNYASVSAAVDPNHIKSIRVLKGLAETNSYGEAGRNGVIVIKTKKK